VDPLADMLLEPAPVVPAVEPVVEPVVDPVLPVLEYEPPPAPIVAFFNTHSPPRADEALPAVPVVPVALLGDSLPRSRHPVTVMLLELLSLLVV
jgi:hypothetical protein